VNTGSQAGVQTVSVQREARQLEERSDWIGAAHLYRELMRRDPTDESACIGLLRTLGKANPGRCWVDIYRDDHLLLDAAYNSGVRVPELVMPLSAVHLDGNRREEGLQVIEEALSAEHGIETAQDVLTQAIGELHSQVPADHEAIVRLHRAYREQKAVALSPRDGVYPLLRGAPGDLRDAYFSTGQHPEWFAIVERLWAQVGVGQRRGLVPNYLEITAHGYRRAERYPEALARGRAYLAYLRARLTEPARSSKLATVHATLMAVCYWKLKRATQAQAALDRAEAYVQRYQDLVPEAAQPSPAAEQVVEPYVNAAVGALHCQQESRAFRLYQRADSLCPGVHFINVSLSALALAVEHDRTASLEYMRRAVGSASDLGERAVLHVVKAFEAMPQFETVRTDQAYLSLFAGLSARSNA